MLRAASSLMLRISALRAQRALEVVEEVDRTALPVGSTVVVIEEDALLGESHRRPLSISTQLDGGERHRDSRVTHAHRVAPYDPFVGDDVVVHRVVAMLGAPRQTTAP